MYCKTGGQGCWPLVRPPRLSSAPTPEHPEPGEPARKPGAAFPECVQGRAAEGAREEPGHGCALHQGPAAFPAQPGGGRAGRGMLEGRPGACPQPSDPGPTLPQDISDCYLELFPSHLYFQAHGSEGLTFQVRGHGQQRSWGRGREQPLGGHAAQSCWAQSPSPSLPLCTGRGCYR